MSTTTEAPVLTPKRVKEIKENARPAKSPCLCMCGGVTQGGRFLPGHDAKLRKMLEATVEAGGPTARPAREALRRLDWA